ncbi:MAG: hypothetical protein DYG89_42585 [Caldilinea sp. CFX5]|nr:hypothetical protein [Caldilinea sp. CFX5]
MNRSTIIRCPVCGFAREELMPTDVCVIRYRCHGCGTILHPKVGDCCVFCSYSNDQCPPQQAESKGACF